MRIPGPGAAILVALCLGVPGARAEAPAPATANLVVAFGAGSGEFPNTTHEFYQVNDELCSRPSRMVLSSTINKGPTAVEAGKTLYLRVVRDTNAHGPKECANVASFVPEAGRTYELDQTLDSDGGCHLEIWDHQSGRPIAYQSHPVPKTCLKSWLRW